MASGGTESESKRNVAASLCKLFPPSEINKARKCELKTLSLLSRMEAEIEKYRFQFDEKGKESNETSRGMLHLGGKDYG